MVAFAAALVVGMSLAAAGQIGGGEGAFDNLWLTVPLMGAGLTAVVAGVLRHARCLMTFRNSPKASIARCRDTHESDLHWRDFYDRWAPRYDWALRIWALLAGFSDANERWKMVSRLELKPGQRVLEAVCD